MDERIFGEMIHLEKRVVRHEYDLKGVKHRLPLTPARPEPDKPLSLTLTTSSSLAYDAACCFYTTDNTNPASHSAQALMLQPDRAAWDTITWGYIRQWQGTLPAQPAGTMVRYHLAARLAESGQWVFANNQARAADEATDFALWVGNTSGPPAWTSEAIIYHIFLDRFYPGDGKTWMKPENLSGFFGGTLRGVIQKLDYIQSFSFNTLWLSPTFASPSHHGYNSTDYYKVEPRLGTNADLRELIDAAHERGMRIILDFVANHWSSSHPTFQEAQRDLQSPYHDWYLWKRWPQEYETYFGVKELPKLNLKHRPARNYILDCARHWLEKGVDGYRLDYALGPSLDFWADFSRACRDEKPDCWLFGEVVDAAPVQLSYASSMDGALDFLLNRALRKTFANNSWTLEEFESFLTAHESYFPLAFSRPAFLDNHDMNRFLFTAGGDKDKLKLAALVLYSLSNPPIVYYGTEAGSGQERDVYQNNYGFFEEARLPMRWGGDQCDDLIDYFRRLGALRRKHAVLNHGERRLLHLDSQEKTYAYLRASGQDRVLIALNMSEIPHAITMPASGLDQNAQDRLNGHKVKLSGNDLIVELSKKSGAFIS